MGGMRLHRYRWSEKKALLLYHRPRLLKDEIRRVHSAVPYDIDTDGDLCPGAKPLTGGMAKDFKEGVQTLINTEFEGFETQVSYDDDDAPNEAGIGVLLPLGVWVNFKVAAVEGD